jgi:spore cortex biosynthesis protein YabQ
LEFSGEARTFFSLIVASCLLGCIFDSYRTARNTFKLKTLGTSFGDFLYWLFAALAVFAVLIFANEGQIRFYVFLALFLGAFIYFRFFSKHVLFFFLKIIKMTTICKNYLKHGLNFLFISTVLNPYRFILKYFLIPFKCLTRFSNRIYLRLLKSLRK